MLPGMKRWKRKNTSQGRPWGSYVPYPGKMESGSRGWTSDCHNRLGGWISNRRNGPEQELYDRTDMEYS